MNFSLLMSYLKARGAAKANNLGGYAGFFVTVGGAGAAYAIGFLDPYIQAFCADPKGYTLQLIVVVALAATAVNSGTTAALSPPKEPCEPTVDKVSTFPEYPKEKGM